MRGPKYSAAVGIVAVLLSATVAWAAVVYSVDPRGKGLGEFNVLKGEPVIWAAGANVGPGGNALDVQGKQERTTIVHYESKKTLCYDMDGKDKKIRLVKKDGSGCQWIAIKIGTRGESDQITLQAAEGKFKGWYLDCTEEEEKIEIGGKTYSFRRMILSKKPGRIDYFLRYPVAP